MKVLGVQKVEECLDGVLIIDFLLDMKVREGFIQYLGNLGRLEYFHQFPRPFYRITRSRHFILKGVEGNDTLQIFYLHYSENVERGIRQYIERYDILETQPELNPLSFLSLI